MDTFDLHIAAQAKSNRTAHVAAVVFLLVIFLLMIVFFLGKYILDQKEIAKKTPPWFKRV